MTTAPAGLLAARKLLLDHLDMHPGPGPHGDLDPAEVGIVGDPDHVGGYHCGEDRVRRVDGAIRDYSVVESPRDRAGLDLHAAGFDVGYFRVTTPVGTVDLYDFNAWLVHNCELGAPDTLDIREVIYTLDGVTVKRWDRLKKRTTGDGSHRTHTHISEHRDGNGRNMTALMTRWLDHIGLIGGDEMDQAEWDTHYLTMLRGTTANQVAIQRELKAKPWQYMGGGIPVDMSTLGVLNATHTYAKAVAGAMPPDLAAQLTAILEAAEDDGDTTVTLPPESIVFFTELRDVVEALPTKQETENIVDEQLDQAFTSAADPD